MKVYTLSREKIAELEKLHHQYLPERLGREIPQGDVIIEDKPCIASLFVRGSPQ